MSMTKKPQEVINRMKFIPHQIEPMLMTIKSHAAWKEDVSLFQGESLLQDGVPFTFILRQGDSTYQFFLSYIDENQNVKHVPFKIELTIRKWFYRNGTGIIQDDLDEFIPLVMHCMKTECIPLKD